LFSEFQSAYRAGHSTETSLLCVFNDVVQNIGNQCLTVLFALDISAAFDTINFDVLADRLKVDFGINGVALEWLLSFLIDRTHYVVSAHRLHLHHYADDTQLYMVVRPADN